VWFLDVEVLNQWCLVNKLVLCDLVACVCVLGVEPTFDIDRFLNTF